MTKREKRIAIVMAFLIVVCMVIYLSPKKKQNKVAKQESVKKQEDKNFVPKARGREDQLDLKNMTEQLQLGSEKVDMDSINDPFRKMQPKEAMKSASFEFADLTLAGIILEEDKEPVALINDQILRVGDEFSGFKVEVIRDNEVLMTKGMEKHTLKLFRDLAENQGE